MLLGKEKKVTYNLLISSLNNILALFGKLLIVCHLDITNQILLATFKENYGNPKKDTMLRRSLKIYLTAQPAAVLKEMHSGPNCMYVVSQRDTLGAGSFSRCPIDKGKLYRKITGSQAKFLK